MAVVAQPKQHQIESRPIREEMVPQCRFIITGREIRTREVRRHRVNVRHGARHMIQQCFLCHSVVALRIASRNVALISPEHVHVFPGQSFPKLRRQQAVERLRRMSARQHERASPRGSHCLVDHADGRLGRSNTQLMGVGGHPHIWFHVALQVERTKRSIARANPSSVFDVVTNVAACCTSSLALAIAMLRPLRSNMSTSFGISPIVAI